MVDVCREIEIRRPRAEVVAYASGEPSGFARLARPLMAAAMGRAMAKDLQRLKAILER